MPEEVNDMSMVLLSGLSDLFNGTNWTAVAVIAGAVGTLAMSGSRLMELIDRWVFKVIRSGNRGYVLLFGVAVRYRTRKGWRLLVLPPLAYIQLIFLLQVVEFSVRQRRLNLDDQKITNTRTSVTYQVRANAVVRMNKDGRSALLSQIKIDDAQDFARLQIQGIIAEIIASADTQLLKDITTLNALITSKATESLERDAGVSVVDVHISTLAPADAQLHKDGMGEIAHALPGEG